MDRSLDIVSSQFGGETGIPLGSCIIDGIIIVAEGTYRFPKVVDVIVLVGGSRDEVLIELLGVEEYLHFRFNGLLDHPAERNV